MKIFESIPNYDDWCEENGLNPDNAENYNAYCEWKANS